jgi:hypothetical protein
MRWSSNRLLLQKPKRPSWRQIPRRYDPVRPQLRGQYSSALLQSARAHLDDIPRTPLGEPDTFPAGRNPLLLAIAAFQYVRNESTAKSSSHLLSAFVTALIDQWDATRGISRTEKPWTTSSRKLAALSVAWAYRLRSTGQSSFRLEEFKEWEIDRTDDHDARQMLRGLWEETNLVTCDHREERWSFCHALVVDYLAARNPVERTGAERENRRVPSGRFPHHSLSPA